MCAAPTNTSTKTNEHANNSCNIGTFAGYMVFLVRHILIALLVLLMYQPVSAQTVWPTPEVEFLYKQARDFHSKGNLREAIIRYQQAIQIAPEVVLLYRELAHAYYLAQGYDEAINTLNPLVEKGVADPETYRVLTQCYLAIGENKRAKRLLRDGTEKYPNSGVLYHEMGLMYENEGELVYAIESWLDGIEKDPGYHINYYEAARFYINTDKSVWTILYGEMFINIEQQTKRAYDTRMMVMNAYRKLFTSLSTGDIPKFGSGNRQGKVGFEEAVYDTYIKLSPVMADGFTTENLTMLRTRFIMDWTMEYARRYPYSLFSRHDDMIRSGYFDAYNQWLFGKVENAQQYEAWQKFHPNAMPAFESWLRRNPYKPVEGDFYNEKIVEGIFQGKKG